MIILTFLVQFTASFQPSLWFRIGKHFLQPKFALEYSLEIIILFGVLYWLSFAMKKI